MNFSWILMFENSLRSDVCVFLAFTAQALKLQSQKKNSETKKNTRSISYTLTLKAYYILKVTGFLLVRALLLVG
jgi:hypothetical protein